MLAIMFSRDFLEALHRTPYLVAATFLRVFLILEPPQPLTLKGLIDDKGSNV